ncbi:hypothetical protein C1645_827089 [Glomus cerebriforme]|uniref:Uncharacterized protein n=1 Tax=Glomus cerebriforme TaxID=658196 RepID=A0A397SSP4_9GLOM|nr:hypothetical protein C1645_827089 [Glomus cerebriforme]
MPLPFMDLNDKVLGISPHYGAATTVIGSLKDSIFFCRKLKLYNDIFNAMQLEWNNQQFGMNNTWRIQATINPPEKRSI